MLSTFPAFEHFCVLFYASKAVNLATVFGLVQFIYSCYYKKLGALRKQFLSWAKEDGSVTPHSLADLYWLSPTTFTNITAALMSNKDVCPFDHEDEDVLEDFF